MRAYCHFNLYIKCSITYIEVVSPNTSPTKKRNLARDLDIRPQCMENKSYYFSPFATIDSTSSDAKITPEVKDFQDFAKVIYSPCALR